MTPNLHPVAIRVSASLLRMSAGQAMACVAEPVGRSEAGHCLVSSAANAAGVAYPSEECGRLVL